MKKIMLITISFLMLISTSIKNVFAEDMNSFVKAPTWIVNYASSEGGNVEGMTEEVVNDEETPLAKITVNTNESYMFSHWTDEEGNLYQSREEIVANVINKNKVFTAIFTREIIEENESEIVESVTLEKKDLPGNLANDTQSLGTLEELFPGDSWLRNAVRSNINRNGGNISSTNVPVTQVDLDLCLEINLSVGMTWTIVTNDTINNLGLLKNLKTIWFGTGFRIEDTNNFWNKIGELHNLEILRLVNPKFENGENKNYTINIPLLPKLKELDLYWWGMGATTTGAVGAGHIFNGESINAANLPALEILELQGVPLTTYQGVATLNNLIELDISHSLIDDIEFVGNLNNLVKFRCSSNSISDFTPIHGLPNLIDVTIGRQNIRHLRDNAVDYYQVTGLAILPAELKLSNGNALTSANFTSFTPVRTIYNNSNSTLEISNLIETDLLQNQKIYEGEFDDVTNKLKPYTTNIVKADFDIPSMTLENGTIVPQGSGYHIYEINFLAGLPSYHIIMNVTGDGNAITKDLTGNTIIKAKEGEIVVIETNPAEGFELVGEIEVIGPHGAIPITNQGSGTFSFIMEAGNTNINITFLKKDYRIIKKDSLNGNLVIGKEVNTRRITIAQIGDKITVELLPDEGYELKDYQIIRNDDKTNINTTLTGNIVSFDMVSSDVTISATFNKKQINIKPTPTPEVGRTCQDDGYPEGYYWNGVRCVAPSGYKVPNTGV